MQCIIKCTRENELLSAAKSDVSKKVLFRYSSHCSSAILSNISFIKLSICFRDIRRLVFEVHPLSLEYEAWKKASLWYCCLPGECRTFSISWAGKCCTFFHDHCYHSSLAAARRETNANGHYLRSLAVTCGHLRSLALGGHLRSLGGHLRSLAGTCGHLLSAVTCGHLRSLEWLQVTASGWFSENQIPRSPRAQWEYLHISALISVTTDMSPTGCCHGVMQKKIQVLRLNRIQGVVQRLPGVPQSQFLWKWFWQGDLLKMMLRLSMAFHGFA